METEVTRESKTVNTIGIISSEIIKKMALWENF